LLARLFTQPANRLVLDEPTNDLDADTLDLLEELLIDYSGTVLVVSHDRAFLNNLVTSIMAFEGDGKVNEYVGGYDDWVRQRIAPSASAATVNKTPLPAATPKPAAVIKPKKLSFKEQKELQTLPGTIETLENDIAGLTLEMGRPEFYQQSRDAVSEAQSRLNKLQQQLEMAYERWEQLEAQDKAAGWAG
ncbi:MAG: ABC transporter ATP-binding protein, partial [Methylococcaceae bacterium]